MKTNQLHHGKSGSALAVRVIPRSPRNEVVGIMDDGTVKIRLTSPPVDGKANRALIKFLSALLDVKANQLEIVAGMTGRNKLIVINGLGAQYVDERILNSLSKQN
jgi:uncharacterized protein (TIGR00251 family)